jgi:hypothetical protein
MTSAMKRALVPVKNWAVPSRGAGCEAPQVWRAGQVRALCVFDKGPIPTRWRSPHPGLFPRHSGNGPNAALSCSFCRSFRRQLAGFFSAAHLAFSVRIVSAWSARPARTSPKSRTRKNRTSDWRQVSRGPLRHATRSSEALSHGDHWTRFIDAASANGDDANVRMILPSLFIETSVPAYN